MEKKNSERVEFSFKKDLEEKKRKTIKKYLMSVGFSRDEAEYESDWIKFARRIDNL